MTKGLGIAALVLSILAIFIPIIGPWLTILIALMAVFAYGAGLPTGIAALIVNVVNLAVFSPQIWLGAATVGEQGSPWGGALVLLFGAQALALVVVLVLHSKQKPESQSA